MDTGEIVKQLMLEHSSRIAWAHIQSIRPVFLTTPETRVPSAHGTCALVEIDGQPVVLTAGHVLDERAVDRFSVGLDFLRPLTGIRRVEELPERPQPDEHLYDVGFVVPDEEFLSHWPRSAYLSTAHVDSTEYKLRDGGRYLVVGYPSDDVPLDTATKFFNCLPLSLTTSEAPAPTVGADQMRPEFQLLLRMNQDELSNEHGPEKGPNPLGASGGAVFSLGEGWKNGGPSSLVGLATVWWHGDHAFLVTDLRRWINFYRTEKAKNFAAGDADATI